MKKTIGKTIKRIGRSLLRWASCLSKRLSWSIWLKTIKHPIFGVTKKKRRQQIIVSLTSYGERLPSMELPLKSLLRQTLKPDRIIVWLACDLQMIPPQIRILEHYGVEFRHVGLDAKSHKKYLFSLKAFPDDYIVTADDDIVFSKNMLRSLWETHQKYPNCIVARRVHRIVFESNGVIANYCRWKFEYKQEKQPSFALCGTSGAGMLFVPNCLDKKATDYNTAKTVAPTADDLWLKYMGLLRGTKTVWAPNDDFPLVLSPDSQASALCVVNVDRGGNDRAIQKLEANFHKEVERSTNGLFYPRHDSRSF